MVWFSFFGSVADYISILSYKIILEFTTFFRMNRIPYIVDNSVKDMN